MSASQSDPQYHFNLGAALHARHQLTEAVVRYRRAIALKADFAEAHYNLGNALRDQGNLDGSIQSYRDAISFDANYGAAYNNLGVALQSKGHFDDAVACYRSVVALDPDSIEGVFNLATLLHLQGLLDEAVSTFGIAIALRPTDAIAHGHLAVVLGKLGRFGDALESYKRAFALNDVPAFRSGFVECVRNCDLDRPDPIVSKLLVRAISEPWVSDSGLAPACIRLIRADPIVGDCIARATRAWPAYLSNDALFGRSGLAATANDPLLRALLECGPVCDVAMERFLTMARRGLLEAASAMRDDTLDLSTMTFYCAIARQCFLNEYIFAIDDVELQQAKRLRELLTVALRSAENASPLSLVANAAYWPLCSLASAEALLDHSWADCIAAVLAQQLAEPLEERALRGTIPRLTDIEDGTSLAVRQQYEESPYPRWTLLPEVANTSRLEDYLHQQFPRVAFRSPAVDGGIDVLIAGCGTGRESVAFARHLPDARIRAIDLSLSSLCYAKRKTLECHLTNIEYAQADIMKLPLHGQSYDLIASVGVLHHLADPAAGLRVLASLLRPGGFMNLGLYSEYGREIVVEARAEIAKRGYAPNETAIRQFRQNLLLGEGGAQFAILATWRDLHVMSECRDLLFHVQEHRFSLPQIKQMLDDNNLEFLGFFPLPAKVLNDYRARFGDDETLANLDYWHYLETELRETFGSMYQFWVRKARSS